MAIYVCKLSTFGAPLVSLLGMFLPINSSVWCRRAFNVVQTLGHVKSWDYLQDW